MGQTESGPSGCCSDRCPPSLATALLAIAIGTLLLLGNLHALDVWDILRFWPLLLIFIGAHMLWRTQRGRAPQR